MDVNKYITRYRPRAGNGFILSGISRITGYSLLELMLVFVILSILTSLGLPGFQSFISSNRLSSHINALAGALAMTRQAAVTRSQTVVICQRGESEACVHDKDRGWNNGWIVFVDANKDHQHNPNEQLLLVQQAITSDIHIKFDGAFNHDGYLMYKPDGSIFPNGSFRVCDANGYGFAKALIISRTGRVRLSRVDARGQKLTCFD